MKKDRKARGHWGERLAARHLVRRGFTILERNWTVKRGELDIIAKEGDTLVFVEVRTRRNDAMVSPEESINHNKRMRLINLAREYLCTHDAGDSEVRFDLVAVRYGTLGILGRCEHYRGIFEADG